jgi:hypothetical protein
MMRFPLVSGDDRSYTVSGIRLCRCIDDLSQGNPLVTRELRQ